MDSLLAPDPSGTSIGHVIGNNTSDEELMNLKIRVIRLDNYLTALFLPI